MGEEKEVAVAEIVAPAVILSNFFKAKTMFWTLFKYIKKISL